MHYFEAGYFQYLLGILREVDQDIASEFAAFFEQDETTGFMVCLNDADYLSFINNIFDGENPEEFLAWSYKDIIASTQGGGNL